MPAELPPTLADSPSPFLRHGATQPVNWYAWSDAAFAEARRENRPVLLDIGAVWCHWCHVMDRESYEDPDTARLINEYFVPIKVDRDERPDIDARYQRAVRSLTGHGGWPLTAFLTPNGDLFYGGTYFPPEELPGRPSFRRVLTEVARIWREEPERAVEAARHLQLHLSELAQEEAAPGRVGAELVTGAIEWYARYHDPIHGGFGRAPKFPHTGALHLLLDRALDPGEETPRRILETTLQGMARGGIHDHLGGGFHRYSVDQRWLVPHFEKMASDNGPLLELYARAAAAFGEPLYRRVVEGVVAYYREVAPGLREEGGYPASQDADLGPDDDGSYWTWTRAEVEEALGGDELLVRAAVLGFGFDDPAAEVRGTPGRRVLHLARGAEEVAAELGVEPGEAERLLGEARRLLRAARDRRPRPFVDESLYAGWLALVASGEIAAARHLRVAGAGESALRALDRIWAEGFDVEDGVAHRLGAPEAGGYLEDQAFFAQALLDAFEWTQRREYLDRARQVVEVMLRRYREPGSGALADRPLAEDDIVEQLATPYLPIHDAPTPSANAVAALVLLRLSHLVDEAVYRERATEILAAFAGAAPDDPLGYASYLRAVDWATAPVTTVAVVGREEDTASNALLQAALACYWPRTVVRWLEVGDTESLEGASLPPELRVMLTGEAPRGYVCVGQSCAAPVSSPEALRALLEGRG